MIPEQIIIMKWNSNNKKYYTEKGYMYTKMHENFEIKVEDLPSKSDAHITLICDYCKQNYSTQRNNILNSKNHCCIKCRHIKIEETYLKRTGFKNPGQNPIVQEKMKQTMEQLKSVIEMEFKR